MYKEFSGEKPGEYYYYDEIVERATFRHEFNDWADEYLTKTVFNRSEEKISLLNGSNIYSIELLLRYTAVQFLDIDRDLPYSTFGESPLLKNVTVLSTILVVIGVVFPIAALMTLPNPIAFVVSGWVMFAFETVLLVLSTAIIISLIEMIVKNIDNSEIILSRYTLITKIVLTLTPYVEYSE
ncbi:hypothetical protein ACM16X_14510 [Haloarcula japonica]|uniref:hypothetical protein n=1 Tax=Haloarcula japonica TaxID=29282 RepID=UPI0039F68C13